MNNLTTYRRLPKRIDFTKKQISNLQKDNEGK